MTEAMEMVESVLARRYRPTSLKIESLADYLQLADVLAKSDIVPSAYRGKPADIVVAMGMGAELGLSPFNALMSIYVVQGRPSLYVEAAIAIVRASGELEVLEVDGTDDRATCRATRRGQGTVELTFTLADAQKLNLTRNPTWTSQPGWMLQCRVIGRVLHRLFPDLLRGVGLVDPAGRPVEQSDVPSNPSRTIDAATGEVLEPAPPPIAGGSLEALTARLAAAPPVSPDPAPEPVVSEPTKMEVDLVRSLVIEKRKKLTISDIVWSRLVKSNTGVEDLEQASLDGLNQLLDAIGGPYKPPGK